MQSGRLELLCHVNPKTLHLSSAQRRHSNASTNATHGCCRWEALQWPASCRQVCHSSRNHHKASLEYLHGYQTPTKSPAVDTARSCKDLEKLTCNTSEQELHIALDLLYPCTGAFQLLRTPPSTGRGRLGESSHAPPASLTRSAPYFEPCCSVRRCPCNKSGADRGLLHAVSLVQPTRGTNAVPCVKRHK